MPPDASVFNQQAIQLAQQGRADESVACFRQGLANFPDHPMLLVNLAGLLNQLDRFTDALPISRRAVMAHPGLADAFGQLGSTLAGLGQYEPAIAAFQNALALRPDFADAHNNLGRVHRKTGRDHAAIEHYRQALALRPASLDFVHNLAEAYCHDRQFDAAAGLCRQVLAAHPQDAYALDLLGAALRGSGLLTQAIAAHQSALALAPDSPSFHDNLGIALHVAGDLDGAIAEHRRAIHLAPGFALAHLNLGLALLLKGDYLNGFPEYEWRLRSEEYRLPTLLTKPRWDGQPLHGRPILVHSEQGFGDTIQFSRYLPWVAARGGRIIFACHRELHRLFAAAGDIQEMIAPGDVLPDYDVHCPLLSLPRIFATTLQTIPPLSLKWAGATPAPTPQDAGLVSIGLVWAGQAAHQNDRNRSLTLNLLAPLFGLRNARFVSLQKGPARDQLSGRFPIADETDNLGDFADTAARIASLDMVITVDTAVAHLAASMGKPTHILLPHIPDWRWLLNRPDSPWYPAVRLYRQAAPGDWQTPVAALLSALAGLPTRLSPL